MGYDAQHRELEVEFESGGVYRYIAVPPEMAAELMRAESKGRYFREQIVKQFSFVRVDEGKRGD